MNIELNKIQKALLSDNPLNSLEELVYLFSNQGLTRQNIYELFLLFHIDNKDSEDWALIEIKFNGDHPIDLTLDRLGGWCNQHMVLLGNEPIDIKQV